MTPSELYLFKMEEITEKTDTYSETIIEEVFRDKRNIQDESFSKNSCLYLSTDYFCKILHIICFTAL